MTIHQLREPCWVITPADDDGWSPHYGLWAEASAAATEIREDDPGSLAVAKKLPGPCWVAECDGTCEDLLGDDGNPLHLHTAAEALDAMRRQGWTVIHGALSGDELAYCGNDKPGIAEPLPPSPAELEADGQLRLPGVLS